MKTTTLFAVFVFLVSLTFIGSIFSVQGLDGDLPSASQFPDEITVSNAIPTMVTVITISLGLLPSPTGVLWFDLIIYGGLSLVLIVGGRKLLPV